MIKTGLNSHVRHKKESSASERADGALEMWPYYDTK